MKKMFISGAVVTLIFTVVFISQHGWSKKGRPEAPKKHPSAPQEFFSDSEGLEAKIVYDDLKLIKYKFIPLPKDIATRPSFPRRLLSKIIRPRYTSELKLNVAAGGSCNIPTIDGLIGPDEIADASHFGPLEGENDSVFEINAKTINFASNDYLYLAIKILKEGIDPTRGYDFYLFFDEGDDGAYGSGSSDGILKSNQDDFKVIRSSIETVYCQHFFGSVYGCPEPSCSSKLKTNCWQCALNTGVNSSDNWSGDKCFKVSNPDETVPSIINRHRDIADGYYHEEADGSSGFATEGIGNEGGQAKVNFKGNLNAFEGRIEAEFLIPFVGFDCNYEIGCVDKSDIRIDYQDTIGLGMVVGAYGYPANLSVRDPSTYLQLVLPPPPDSDE